MLYTFWHLHHRMLCPAQCDTTFQPMLQHIQGVAMLHSYLMSYPSWGPLITELV